MRKEGGEIPRLPAPRLGSGAFVLMFGKNYDDSTLKKKQSW